MRKGDLPEKGPGGKSSGTWEVGNLNDAVEAEFIDLPVAIQARMVRVFEFISEVGLENVGYPYVKHVDGDIWEIRVEDKVGWGRCLYTTAPGRRVVLLRHFMKKSNKTPKREIDLAKQRKKTI